VADLLMAEERDVEVADGVDNIKVDDVRVEDSEDIKVEDAEFEGFDVKDEIDVDVGVDVGHNDVAVSCSLGQSPGSGDGHESGDGHDTVVFPADRELKGAHTARLAYQPTMKNLRNIMNDRLEKRRWISYRRKHKDMVKNSCDPADRQEADLYIEPGDVYHCTSN